MARALSCEDESLVDYFIIATKRFDGSAAQLSFVYPPLDDDHDETDFCENVTMFQFPHGYVHSWDGRSLPPPPAHNLFTLTDMHGDHLYGASISFFETANHVKSLCVLTRRPFYTQMLRYLEQLVLLGLHQARHATGDNAMVEKALCNLFHEVPVPYRGLAVQLHVGGLDILLERPPFLDFPFEVDAELMLYAFMMIDPKVLQQLYHHVLLEHRVLIVGNDSVLVTAVVETLKGLVFPLTWLHVVIPNIPDSLDLSTLLDAPVPFLAGAHTGQLQHVAIPSNVVKYDLTESRLVVPSTSNNTHQFQYQQDLESVVLPTLPEASTRLLQKLSTTRLTDLHTQKKELHQKLWDRRIQLQKCCLATTSSSTNSSSASRPPVITPKQFFLVKQSLVYKKMMKLYLDVITSMLQDFAPPKASHLSKPFDADKFFDKKPSTTRAFYKAFIETAQFQSFIAQHHEYTAGRLPLEDAAKFQFVHKTLLTSERITGNQADASRAVATALTKTFVAHTPLACEALSVREQVDADLKVRLEIVFPAVNIDAFGEPRKILFPSMATDAVHSSLGTFISPSDAASRRASKDTSDWMQSFMRTVPLPSALIRSDLLSSSLSSSSSRSNNNSSSHERSKLSVFRSPQVTTAAPPVPVGLPAAAPIKRSRTIDRLKKVSPFYRTMTQKALDSTLKSLASAATPPPKRPATVVRSIWLITTSSCACRDRIVLLTQSLVEQLQLHGTKTATQVATAYCDLIYALASCGHPSEAKAVFEECLSGSALVSLAPIAGKPHFWKPFSALLRCYITNGLVQRAFDLLSQVHMDDAQHVEPPLGVLQFTAHVLGVAKEVMVERLYVTFSCGNLGLRLAPSTKSESEQGSSESGVGCELIAFEDESDHDAEGDSSTTVGSLESTSGLRVHDLVETVNGAVVLHQTFDEIVTALKQASRPMTVTFVRGLDRLTMPMQGDTDGGRSVSSASATSVSSTSAVVDGRSGVKAKKVSASSSSTSSSKSTPRRDLCDRFGLLPTRGIRLTALTDCECCGTRLSFSEVKRGWSPNDTNDHTTKCHSCGHRFVPRLCVMLGVMTSMYQPTLRTSDRTQLPPDAQVEQVEYLSMPMIRKELSTLAQKVPLTLLPMKDLRDMKPQIYWNIVVKLLSLDVPLDFLALPDATTKSKDPMVDTNAKPIKALPTEMATADDDDHEMRMLRELVMKRVERVSSRTDSQNQNQSLRMEAVLTSLMIALTEQTKEALQVKSKATTAVPNRNGKQWSLLGSESTSNTKSPLNPSPMKPTTTPTAKPKTSVTRGFINSREDDVSGYDDLRRLSSDDEERETDVEDMRSSRTMSVTDSLVMDDALPTDPTTIKAKPRNNKFMPGLRSLSTLPSAPFQRSSRGFPSAR